MLKNKYSAIKSCVSLNSVKTDFFVCNKGLRQGEQLSPILFYLFLNDLDNYIAQTNVNNLNIVDNDLDIFFKLVVLLYADDTVVFSNTEDVLIYIMHTFANYCDTWKLNINYIKTKV